MNNSQGYTFSTDKLIFYCFCGFFFFLPIATSPAVICGIFTISVWIVSGKFVRDREWLKKKWTMPVIIFMLLPWIGLLYTDDLQTGLEFSEKSYYWLYAFAITSQSFHSRPLSFINAFLLGLTVTVCISLMQFVGLLPILKGEATGFTGGSSSHITYSLLLVFGMLVLSFYFTAVTSKMRKTIILILICAYFLSLSVNQGRIGYLAFIVLSPLMLYNLIGRKSMVGTVVATFVAVVILLSSSMVWDRIELAVNEVRGYYSHGVDDTSVGARLYMWDGAVRIFLENPIIGTGTGGYKSAMKKYKNDADSPVPVHPHNSFLYMASSFGMVGLLTFLWLIVVYLQKGWQARQSIVGYSVLSFGLVLLIGSLTDTQILSLATGSMFAVLMGLESGNSVYQDKAIKLQRK